MKACATVAFLLILSFTEAKERPNRNGERAYSHEKSLASSSVPPPRAGGRDYSSVGLKHGTARSGGSVGVPVPPKAKEAPGRHHHADVKSSGNLRAKPKAGLHVIETNTFPLGLCEGDCDSNADCGPGLICYQRDEYESVPLCSGGAEDSSRSDYCVPSGIPIVAETNSFPLGLCEGDCDSNDDCKPGLICYQRGDYEAEVPGCFGGPADGSQGQTNYCVPSGRPHILETNSFPLGRCEGDCDSNDDCEPGLICFQRDAFESVPGCAGGSGDSSLTDYCVVPSGKPQIAETNSFPLGQCEGDCYSNADCEPDLICYQRDAFESVPGCSGGSEDGSQTNYCVPLPHTEETNLFPLGYCEGDCDSDGDCTEGLICFQRDEFESVPGCAGGSEDSSRTDFCVKRWSSPPIHIAETNSFPLGLCEGDCDSNDDCKPGLICYQREWYESVPGCVGGSDDWSRTDYCVLPSVEETNSFPLGRCEGDCDSNDDCEPGLICYQRDGFESVPGCAGGSEDSSRTDYCVPVPHTEESIFFPLGYCQGGCRTDYDCTAGLICFQRDEFEPVPGCAGGSEDSSRTNYCVKPDQVQVAAAPSFSEISSWLGDSSQHLGQSVALSGDGKSFAYGLLSETTTNAVSLADTRSDLEGSEIGDEFGYAIALSHDGQRMAIGIPNSSVGTVEGAGRVKVYEYDQTGDTWTQMGGDLVSSIPNEWGGRFGHSVSLNNDGDVVAVGAPSSEGVSIFRFENNEWVRMGDDIALSLYSAAAHGWSVSLSSDGLVVAVGAATNEQNWDEAGACFVYEYVSNNWQQRGQPILGQQRHGLLGTSVSLSADGNIVAIGSINYSIEESSGERAGAVFVYEYSSEGDWKSLGGDVFGDNAYDRFGRSVSLAKHENKLYLAAGAPDHDGGGHVRLFVFDDEHSYWNQVEEVPRDADDDEDTNSSDDDDKKGAGFGTTVVLVSGSDGLRMAVGAPGARSGYERLGLIPMYVGEPGEVTLWQK